MLIFISGGVRSGKSSFAEEWVNQFNHKVYIATMKVQDEESKERVVLHQERRTGYKTIECSSNLKGIVDDLANNDVVLLDCLTNWLSNEMFDKEIVLDVTEEIVSTISRINEKVKHLVIVSNDVFTGVTKYDDYTYRFLQNLGDIHQIVVRNADEVYELYAGVPRRHK